MLVLFVRLMHKNVDFIHISFFLTDQACNALRGRFDKINTIFGAFPSNLSFAIHDNRGVPRTISVDLSQSTKFIGDNVIVNNLFGEVCIVCRVSFNEMCHVSCDN